MKRILFCVLSLIGLCSFKKFTCPSITFNPFNVTVCAPSGASFTVSASGTAISYQWQVSTDGGVTWSNVTNAGPFSGASTSTLTISNATGLNGYQFRVVVSAASCASVTSLSAQLTVNTPPMITMQPANVTTCSSLPASFTISASGSGITFQWQLSSDGGITWSNLANGGVYSGVTTSILSINNTAGLNGYQFRVFISGYPPCASATSNPATLTVSLTNTWTGSVSSAWENAGNWSCGVVPDSFTDVYIPAGAVVVLNSNVSIATLHLNPSASLTVNPPYVLTLLGH